MRISAGALLRASGRGKDFGYLSPKPCARATPIRLESQGFQGIRLCSVRSMITGFAAGFYPYIVKFSANKRVCAR